jgi:Zn-finger nucleic acid-binding protein
LDFDAFAADATETSTGSNGRDCPRCLVKMGVIAYKDAGVCIDKCVKCLGVWLDHGEFGKIVHHLEQRVDAETVAQYREEAGRQLAQVFKGPRGPLSELRDLFAVLHLLRTRMGVEHPALADTINTIYLANPFK